MRSMRACFAVYVNLQPNFGLMRCYICMVAFLDYCCVQALRGTTKREKTSDKLIRCWRHWRVRGNASCIYLQYDVFGEASTI